MVENLSTYEKKWLKNVNNMKEVGLSQVVAWLWEFGVLLASTNYIPSNNSVLAICFVLFFHTNRMVVGFPLLGDAISLCLCNRYIFYRNFACMFFDCGFLKLLWGWSVVFVALVYICMYQFFCIYALYFGYMKWLWD